MNEYATASAAVEAILSDVRDHLYIHTPSKSVVSALVERLHGGDQSRTVRVLVPDPICEAVLDEFFVAGRIADLHGDGFEVRTTATAPSGTFFSTANRERLVTLVTLESVYSTITVDDQDVVDANTEALFDCWEAAEPMSCESIPVGFDELADASRAELGLPYLADLNSALYDRDSYPVDGDGILGLRELLTVIAAKNRLRSTDFVTWCEECLELCSHQTVYNTIEALEDQRVVSTDRVQNDSPGRPPRRLVLNAPYSDLPAEELPTAVGTAV